jgi:hypothetical protein
MHDPAPTTTLRTPPPHPYPPSPITVSHGAPKTEPQWLSFRFWTQTPSPPHVSQTHDPATATTLYTPPPHPYPPSPIIVSHGTPETKPQRLNFGFWTQTCSPPHISWTLDPTTTTTSSVPLYHLPSPLSTFISIGVPAIELQWLGFWFLAHFKCFLIFFSYSCTGLEIECYNYYLVPCV